MEATELRFPGGNTCMHTPTVKLAGKTSLSDFVVVVSKDQMNYVSQDAWRRVNCSRFGSHRFLGNGVQATLKINGPDYP